MSAAFEVLHGILRGLITLVTLAGIAAMLYAFHRAAPVFVSFIRFFIVLLVGQVKRAWRADVDLWRTIRRGLRGLFVIQVLAVEPGDVVVVNFAPGVVVDSMAMIEARLSIERVLRASLGPNPGRGVQIIVGKGIDVSVVRQVSAQPKAVHG